MIECVLDNWAGCEYVCIKPASRKKHLLHIEIINQINHVSVGCKAGTVPICIAEIPIKSSVQIYNDTPYDSIKMLKLKIYNKKDRNVRLIFGCE